MSFQFVNATPADIDYSPETRRRIRSQAMRDYRRRQRDEDNDIVSSPEPSPPSSIASLSASSHSQSRGDSRQRHSSSQSLSVQPGILRRHSSGTSSDNPPPSRRRPVSGSKRPSPQSPLEGETSQGSHRRRRHDDEPRAQHGVFSQFMINLPTRSTPTLGEDMEALSSPGRLEQMLATCEDYNSWLTSSIPTDAPPSAAEHASYDDKTSRMLLSALCLQSIGHLEIVRPGETSLEKNLLKTSVLALLNKRLKNASKALEDNTVGALACLANYEMSQGSTEATMHLSGLQQILKLRGGTRNIGDTAGLPMMLEILDLTHAVYFHASPMYTSAEPSRPSSHEQTPALPLPPRAGAGRGELDQSMLDDISNFILSIPELAETGEELLVPEMGGPPVHAQAQTGAPSTFEEEVELWHRIFSEASVSYSTVSREEGVTLTHVCRLAADLHLLATSAVQAHPMRIQAKSEQLFEALSSTQEDALNLAPELHTRILLNALSSASIPKSKAWYHAQLTRRLYQTSAEDWASVKALVMRFIEMQIAAAQQPRSQAVMALVGGLDVEIVVESAGEAEKRDWRVC